MHPGHRFLPYFSRLDDGVVVERKHPAGATLAAGSAQACGRAKIRGCWISHPMPWTCRPEAR